jgi:hypothetical protein
MLKSGVEGVLSLASRTLKCKILKYLQEIYLELLSVPDLRLQAAHFFELDHMSANVYNVIPEKAFPANTISSMFRSYK